MTCIVTNATAIQFINDKCQIQKWKSRKTALSGYYACVSHNLLLMSLGVDTHTHILTHEQKQFQEPGACGLWLHVPGLKIFFELITVM